MVAGVIIGISIILWCLTLAALIFKGELAPFMSRGASHILLGATLLAFVTALTSSFPATIAAPDEAAGVIISLVATSLVGAGDVVFDAETIFATVLALIVVSTILSATVFIGLGYFKLGNLVRFIPHPVVGGVVVTMGWLLVSGAFNVMSGVELEIDSIPQLLTPLGLLSWMPGVLFAMSLLVVMRRWNHVLVLPGFLLGGIALFYATSTWLGLSIEELQARGWLLDPLPGTGVSELFDPKLLTHVEWAPIALAIPDIGSLVLLCVLGLLLSATALEVAAQCDMDLNRELVSTGFANLLSGLVGGITGSHSLEDTLIAREMNASSRLVGVVTAIVCAAGIVYGVDLLAYLPKSLLGGFVLFFGLVLLYEWIFVGWRRLPRADYFVVMLCLLVSLSAGYLAGIGIGIIGGVMIFVFNYSRVDVVKHAASGADYHSNVERDPRTHEFLSRHGGRILVLRLQGFIFFGTAHRIYNVMRQRLQDTHADPLAFVLLDFRSVPGVDSSTAASFFKMKHLAEKNGFVIVLSNLGNEVAVQLEKLGALNSNGDPVRVFADIDRGLEWCENRLLELCGADSIGIHGDIGRILEGSLAERRKAAALKNYLEEQVVPKGTTIIKQGDPSNDLFFVESGRVAIQLEIPGRTPVRLRSMGPGTVVGEVALYLRLPRSASVVAEEDSTLYRLTGASLEKMRRNDAALAAAFNEFIVRMLAGRLVDANKMLRAMME